ncbi:PaaI family thioesterase [Pseudoruegeria sp. SK021]|uniref:PaaI family thioesterase n=1 Tax=Pseudoruegeria sp. SK021 TaxID=1933035 RepID=UPI000A22F9CD|nr:PaaI family thioesterase [Pseudoruegeria sp. SK021]OSP55538.1 thioesterase [Pseudoruegeria sp. SK021]
MSTPIDPEMTHAALNAFLRAEFPQVAERLALSDVRAMGVSLRLHVGPAQLRPGGTVSGPAMFELADVAAYLAVLSQIGPVALAVTTSASIDFMRKPAAEIDMIATADLLKLGKTLAVVDVKVFSENDMNRLIARASLTYSIPVY